MVEGRSSSCKHDRPIHSAQRPDSSSLLLRPTREQTVSHQNENSPIFPHPFYCLWRDLPVPCNNSQSGSEHWVETLKCSAEQTFIELLHWDKVITEYCPKQLTGHSKQGEKQKQTKKPNKLAILLLNYMTHWYAGQIIVIARDSDTHFPAGISYRGAKWTLKCI